MAFSAQIEANIGNFTKNLDKATQDISKFQDNVAKKLDRVGDSFIKVGGQMSKFVSAPLAGAIAGMGALALSTAQATKDLESMSVVTGVSVQKLQEYEHIATKATVPTNTLSSATLNLQRRLRDTSDEAGGATEILRNMGVSLYNLDGTMKSSGQVTEDAIKAFAGLEDGVEKSAKGYQVFGGQWQNIAQIADLGVDAIESLSKEANDLGLVLSDEAVSASAKFGIEIDVLKNRLTALKNQIGASLAPVLTDTLLPVIENQIMPAVKRFADFIKNLIDRFNELSPATKTLIASITGIAIALGPTLVALGGLLKLLPLIGAGFTALTGPVGIAIAAIVAGAALIIKNWDAIKEYFTEGAGSEMFNNVKELALNLWDSLKSIFTNIKNVVTDLWDRMGGGIVKSFRRSFDLVITIISEVARTFNNFINIFKAQSVSEALSSMGKFFTDAFNGIKNIVFKAVAQMTQGLANFFRFLRMNKLADTMEQWADSIAPVKKQTDDLIDSTDDLIDSTDGLTGLTDVNPEIDALKKEIDALNKEIERLKKNSNNISTESIIPQGSLKELSEKLKVLYEQLDNETTQSGRIKVSRLINDLENKVVRIKVAIDFENALKPITNTDLGVSPIIDLSPQIDKMGADLDRMKAVFDEKNQEIAQGVQMMNQMLVGGFIGVFESLGNAIGSGENVLGALGKSLVGALGDMAIQVGSLMIGFGKMAESLWALIATPLGGVVAVAAGAALIALGAAAKAAVSGAMGSVGGGGYSGGGGYQSSRVDAPIQQGEFQYRDSYSQQQVEFKISGDSLVGVLDKKQTRNNRNV